MLFRTVSRVVYGVVSQPKLRYWLKTTLKKSWSLLGHHENRIDSSLAAVEKKDGAKMSTSGACAAALPGVANSVAEASMAIAINRSDITADHTRARASRGNSLKPESARQLRDSWHPIPSGRQRFLCGLTSRSR